MFTPDVEDLLSKEAREQNAEWHRKHPNRSMATYRLTFREQLAVRQHEVNVVGRTLTPAEQDAFLKGLKK